MARFLTTRATALELERIINTAQNAVVLMSPYIKVPDSLFQNLKAADQKGVRTKIVYGKKRQLGTGVEKQLAQLKHVELLFLENLHAKCYFNEHSLVITSLNLYDFSEQNNREMGVLITKEDDEVAFSDALSEAAIIIGQASGASAAVQSRGTVTGQARPQPKPAEEKSKRSWAKPLSSILSGVLGTERGYCIRCGKRIAYDVDAPYCQDCYREWNKYKNPAYKEKHCHRCGRQKRWITKIKPRCSTCYAE